MTKEEIYYKMRYVVIEYEGSHSVSNPNRDLIGYEFSDDLEYLRDKYSLPIVTNSLDWQIENQGFSLYHKVKDLGILLIDKEVINENSPYVLNITPLFINVMRDSQLEKIL
jgi:hypothetical protein